MEISLTLNISATFPKRQRFDKSCSNIFINLSENLITPDDSTDWINKVDFSELAIKVVNFNALFFTSFLVLISLNSCTAVALLLKPMILFSVGKQKDLISRFIIFKQKQTSLIAISRSLSITIYSHDTFVASMFLMLQFLLTPFSIDTNVCCL